jgi:hypothetical protein
VHGTPDPVLPALADVIYRLRRPALTLELDRLKAKSFACVVARLVPLDERLGGQAGAKMKY